MDDFLLLLQKQIMHLLVQKLNHVWVSIYHQGDIIRPKL